MIVSVIPGYPRLTLFRGSRRIRWYFYHELTTKERLIYGFGYAIPMTNSKTVLTPEEKRLRRNAYSRAWKRAHPELVRKYNRICRDRKVDDDKRHGLGGMRTSFQPSVIIKRHRNGYPNEAVVMFQDRSGYVIMADDMCSVDVWVHEFVENTLDSIIGDMTGRRQGLEWSVMLKHDSPTNPDTWTITRPTIPHFITTLTTHCIMIEQTIGGQNKWYRIEGDTYAHLCLRNREL